jgi:uncharacterized delta-60 repeat protein
MHTRIALGAAGAALAAVIAMAGPAQAQTSGSLDTSFGSGGLVTLPSGVGTPAQILAQPDGLIDVVSTVTDPNTGNSDIGVLQYEANGTLNTSFGTDGEALASFSGDAIAAISAALAPGGQIVVAGQGGSVEIVTASGTTGGGPGEEAVAEFNSDGTLDSSFGTGGEVITQDPSPIGEGDDSSGPVIVQPNGDIVTGGGVAGTECNPRKNCVTDDVLTRYLPNGSLDTTFGTGGFSEVDDTSFATIGLGEDSSGNIYAFEGNNLTGPTPLEFSPSGAEESATTSTPPSLAEANGFFFSDGTYVIGQSVSEADNATDAQAVLHDLPSGAVDPNFSNPPFDYANETGSAQDGLSAAALASNGDIVVTGIHCTGILTRKGCRGTDQVGVARLTSTGSLDTSFGNDGVTVIADGNSISALTLVPDGDILVAFGSTIAAVLSS